MPFFCFGLVGAGVGAGWFGFDSYSTLSSLLAPSVTNFKIKIHAASALWYAPADRTAYRSWGKRDKGIG